MTLRSDLRTTILYRLGDIAGAIFTVTELNFYIDKAIKSLYPTYWKYQTATTTAGAGPLQVMPANCRNLYYVGELKSTATRVRMIRQWKEGVGSSFIPKVNITGEQLVWAWTTGFTPPVDDISPLDINVECEEFVVLRCCISALERVASSRVETVKYFSLTVREGVTEQDIIIILDAYHASLEDHIKSAIARPARVG